MDFHYSPEKAQPRGAEAAICEMNERKTQEYNSAPHNSSSDVTEDTETLLNAQQSESVKCHRLTLPVPCTATHTLEPISWPRCHYSSVTTTGTITPRLCSQAEHKQHYTVWVGTELTCWECEMKAQLGTDKICVLVSLNGNMIYVIKRSKYTQVCKDVFALYNMSTGSHAATWVQAIRENWSVFASLIDAKNE